MHLRDLRRDPDALTRRSNAHRGIETTRMPARVIHSPIWSFLLCWGNDCALEPSIILSFHVRLYYSGESIAHQVMLASQEIPRPQIHLPCMMVEAICTERFGHDPPAVSVPVMVFTWKPGPQQ
jgi:hypothetical protein